MTKPLFTNEHILSVIQEKDSVLCICPIPQRRKGNSSEPFLKIVIMNHFVITNFSTIIKHCLLTGVILS